METVLSNQVAQLFREHGSLVLLRCRRLLRDESAADDAAQEVFLRVVKNLARFRGEASQVTWLYRIATNVCLDELRRRARRTTVELTLELQEALSVAQPSAEDAVIGQDRVEWLLRRVDATSLQILVHTYLDEMTQEEIAGLMGLSRKTVWTRLKRLRRRLERKR